MGASIDFEQNILTIAFLVAWFIWLIENCRRYQKSRKNWKEKTNGDWRTSKLETQILFTEQKALLRLPKQFHFVTIRQWLQRTATTLSDQQNGFESI